MSTSVDDAPVVREDALYAGGRWVTVESSARITVRNPYDLSVVGVAPDGSAADVDVAVRAAREAFDHGPWPRMSPAERADALIRLAEELERRSGDTADLVTAEMGQPITTARAIAGGLPPLHLRYFADLIRGWDQEEVRTNIVFPGSTVVRNEPIGVAGIIVPWNYPQSLMSSKYAPALAVGCTVVIKPAAETPLDALALAEAVEAAGLPPGVVNIVTGGRETGEALVDHPGVDKIAFTGSTAAGRRIAARCGERLIPATLELGGKSAAIVLDDADDELALNELRSLSFMNSGQTCFLLSRVLVPRRRFSDFTGGLATVAESLVLGDPRDEATEQGPLVSERIRTRVRSLVDDGVAQGARVVTGGRQLADAPGFFYEPTVLVDVDQRSALAQEEVFGPVVIVTPYDSEEEAISLANDTIYGLGGAVFSSDEEHALRVARRIETGTIGINGYRPDHGSPFGGYKASGIGRENGPEVLSSYLKIKSVFG